MACFDDVVALKELCTEQESFSGIWLNDVGITRSFIESVITSDYDNIQDFVDSKTRHAMNVVQSMVHGRFGNMIRNTSLIHQHRLGFTANNTPVSTGGDFKGIQMTLSNTANYINMELSQLSLQVNTNGTVPITVYDLYQNKLIDTISVTAVSGQIVTVFPHKIYKSELRPLNLFIGYDATGITSITTHIREAQCCGNYSCSNQYMTSKGVTNATGTFIAEDNTALSHTAGLSLVYSLSCDPYSWMCGYARVLALPIAYKIASEMYLHGLQAALNDRSSNTTNLNVEALEKTQAFYERNFNEQMDRILSHLQVPEDTACFQCNTPSRNSIILP